MAVSAPRSPTWSPARLPIRLLFVGLAVVAAIGAGRIAYDAYSAYTGGKSAITGDLLPAFSLTPTIVQAAWIAAALAVVAAIQDKRA